MNTGLLEDEIEYCQKLIKVVKSNEVIASYPVVAEKLNSLQETVDDDVEVLNQSKDSDVATSAGLIGMQMQGALAIFAVNMKRILTLSK